MGFLDMRAEIGNLEAGLARASDSRDMILTCPECATGYFVEDGQIKAEGRAVRCASCNARWTAYPEAPLDLLSDAAEASPLHPKPIAPAAASGPTEAIVTLTGDDLPRQFRNRAEDERRMRQALVTGVIWAAAGLAVAIVILLAILMREQVVRAWPQTASAYAAIGLPVNPTGLMIEQVQAAPSLQDGHAALTISGVIRNVVGHTELAPPLRITLLNAQGKRVAGQIATLGNANIPPGETRHFVTSIFDPPFSAASLQVDFALGAQGGMNRVSATAAPPPSTPTIALRGPATDPSFTPAAANAMPLPPEPASAPDATNTAPAPAAAAAPTAPPAKP
jgi:predicted Zn finger-like uncharacterized protein